MIAGSKQSIDEVSLRYQAQTVLADIANESAASRSLNRANDNFLKATKIRLWLKALDYKLFLTRNQREKLWYALIDISGVYDNPTAPVLDKVNAPNVLVGTSVKKYRKSS